ncbi:PilW family protein [Moritella sp. 24]|uniref:PilW family protein n=1 Tax=Moritella sp. 24 TaxID=2746230 RepID=UPI001BA484AA|nr:PilW family protein [Moritella sp. 24]QUM75219.1 PilW family protein [Moritella sp. 24]
MTAKQAGFNLIELMIALVVGIVLMASITTMFVDTKVSANRSSTVSNLQQQAQLALQVLVDDVRSIGSWAEFSGEDLADIQVPNIAGVNCSIVPAVGAVNAGNAHIPVTANWILSSSVVGVGNVNVANACLAPGYTISGGSDVVSIARVRGLITAVSDINSDSYYVAIAPQQAQLFEGRAPNGATNIDNVEIYPYVQHTYIVESHAIDGPRLSRFSFTDGDFITDMVVGNIEQIRIDFGVDNNEDGRADNYNMSANITEQMWRMNQIVSARIYVLARAKNKDMTFNNDAAYNVRFLPFTPTNNDNYRRFLLATTVVIKNNMMAVTQ